MVTRLVRVGTEEGPDSRITSERQARAQLLGEDRQMRLCGWNRVTPPRVQNTKPFPGTFPTGFLFSNSVFGKFQTYRKVGRIIQWTHIYPSP